MFNLFSVVNNLFVKQIFQRWNSFAHVPVFFEQGCILCHALNRLVLVLYDDDWRNVNRTILFAPLLNNLATAIHNERKVVAVRNTRSYLVFEVQSVYSVLVAPCAECAPAFRHSKQIECVELVSDIQVNEHANAFLLHLPCNESFFVDCLQTERNRCFIE
nr:MAG TPA: cytochrome c-552 [Caudoviricetes sp.]